MTVQDGEVRTEWWRVFELCLSAVSTGIVSKPYKIVVKMPQVTGSEWFGTDRSSGKSCLISPVTTGILVEL